MSCPALCPKLFCVFVSAYIHFFLSLFMFVCLFLFLFVSFYLPRCLYLSSSVSPYLSLYFFLFLCHFCSLTFFSFFFPPWPWPKTQVAGQPEIKIHTTYYEQKFTLTHQAFSPLLPLAIRTLSSALSLVQRPLNELVLVTRNYSLKGNSQPSGH